MNKTRRLGKGLDTLLSRDSLRVISGLQEAKSGETGADRQSEGLRHIAVGLIQPGQYQPRTDLQQDRLQELAASIKAQGVVQPVVVRPVAGEKFELIAGERRWRATQIAGIDTIPAIVREAADETVVAMALIENIQREDLNPIDQAMAMKRLQDEFQLTQQQVAETVGKSRATVANLLRLIGLHEDVRRMLQRGELEMGHARALLALPGAQQATAAQTVATRGLSVRQTEALVRRLVAGPAGRPGPASDPDIKHLEEKLEQTLGASVMLQHTDQGKGRLVVKYNSLDELDGILSHIR